ncbi:Ric1p KNAG_0A05970 [Huiozyma naganishii CBS 8797]|uniref:RIC1 C-terminal alpha solenoid region domain-containing protein n=1 Tax=Huiozyma naganishii (strain ATCC MYA-139 / BCRC 22969 / CBS 8797 / KCTC 17520 / NBRC 10181 / NCYC 3082 / Yp74L-3) TaxID=1071383 RepID=J7S2M7_HUIN7|nr:hypothetical protein KNAG_0A05970 [Kazachstania naganishii CBS 8797]CCK68259.1 hypothetical protein KNAG_0A05970 [Kazachstania naganishii CBS 8797]
MQLWPFSPPQQFSVSKRASSLDGLPLDDNEIVGTLTLPQSNVLIMATPARALVYNLKPLALVAVHERTASSIEEFGLNISLRSSMTFDNPINGLVSKKETEFLAWYKGKLVFYVITANNFLLTYQILKNSTQMTTFKEYGLPIIDPSNFDEDLEQDYDYNADDDTLTVFEKNNSSRMIQNGYVATKDKGFLGLFSTHNELAAEEVPIKNLELRLKIVLKFDFDVVDIVGFKKFTEIGDGRYEENLIVLYPHGLQLLRLVDFKLSDSTLVKIERGLKICVCNEDIYVVGNDPQSNKTLIHQLDISKLSSEAFMLCDNGPLHSTFQIKKQLVLCYERKVVKFDTLSKSVCFEFNLPFNSRVCKPINDDTLLFISDKNTLHFYTTLGNLLFLIDHDSPHSYPHYNYSDFTSFSNFLVTTSKRGEFQLWELWKEYSQTHYDFRNTKVYLLNRGNDILFYSPQSDAPLSHEILPVIKLPLKSLNNYISTIRINGNLKLMALFISNKNLLLIHNMETNVWFNYSNLTIIDMHWLANNYLVVHLKHEDGSRTLQCLRIPLQGLETKELSEFVIWEYSVPENERVVSFHVNTLFRYKPLKIKGKEPSKLAERYFKTAEIILLTDTRLLVFDAISTIDISGVNLLKRFHLYIKVEIPNDSGLADIEWAMSFREGLLIYAGGKILRLDKMDADEWNSVKLLSNVERILDVQKDQIFLLQENRYLYFNITDLWDNQNSVLERGIEDEEYPVAVSPASAILHSLHCIFNKDHSKLVVKHEIYLDKLILARMQVGASVDDITTEFHNLKHYKFALEKILSSKILEHGDLTQILNLVKSCHGSLDQSLRNPNSDMLEIVSNCLRKIETKHWRVLFSSLHMTPRDLLALCIEGNEAKMLGILLLVFLNFNGEELLIDSSSGSKWAPNLEVIDEHSQEAGHEQETTNSELLGVDKILSDEELMLRVLNILVSSAAGATDPNRASEAWDLCFQLVRFLRELDKQNSTSLVQKAVQMLQQHTK